MERETVLYMYIGRAVWRGFDSRSVTCSFVDFYCFYFDDEEPQYCCSTQNFAFGWNERRREHCGTRSIGHIKGRTKCNGVNVMDTKLNGLLWKWYGGISELHISFGADGDDFPLANHWSFIVSINNCMRTFGPLKIEGNYKKKTKQKMKKLKYSNRPDAIEVFSASKIHIFLFVRLLFADFDRFYFSGIWLSFCSISVNRNYLFRVRDFITTFGEHSECFPIVFGQPAWISTHSSHSHALKKLSIGTQTSCPN